MKYIFAFFILLGTLIGLGILVFGCAWLQNKIKEWERKFEHKYPKYKAFKYKFEEDILPWTCGIFILGLLLVSLVATYMWIVKRL